MWRWDQGEPFGVNVPDEDPSGLGAFDLPLRLPGQYFDKETNLHYNYFRDYDPHVGRYIQSDPIGLRGGLNGFLYGRGSPIQYIDPRGEAAGVVVIGGTALIVGTAIYLSSPAGKKSIKSIVQKIQDVCRPANDDDDVDCEEWLKLINDEYAQIAILDAAGGDMRLTKKQHNQSVVLFCKVCAYLCHKAKSF